MFLREITNVDLNIQRHGFDSGVDRLKYLEAVCSCLAKHNHKLKASKCDFLRSMVTYLGHIVSEESIETDTEKLASIRTRQKP